MERTYKGYGIVKQSVGRMGWNVTNKEGRCVKTGFKTLADAKDWVTMECDRAEWMENQ